MEPIRNLARLRFGLRFLLGCTLVIATVLAWTSWQLSAGRFHKRIATKLSAAGCSVDFSHRKWVPMANPPPSLTRGGIPLEEISTLPDFVERSGLGVVFRRVANVTFRQRSDMPTGLELLKELKRVEILSFYDAGVTQFQLADTLRKVRIKKLYIQAERLPRTRMNWLNHDGLTWLCVGRTQFSNPAINDLPLSLEYLDARRTRINDDGLDSFVRLRNLTKLNLRRTPTTEKEIEALRQRMPWCTIEWERLKQP